jgi:hypothetical protein
MKILHEIPGRVRVYYPDLKMSPNICRQITYSLSARQGIISVRTEPRISTVVVYYDQAALSFDQVIRILSVFELYDDGQLLSRDFWQQSASLRRAVQRSAVSGVLLTMSYATHFLQHPNALLDVFTTIFTGYTVLSHGDRKQGRIRHPDIITAFITSFALGPTKMTEVALTSWIVNALELIQDYHQLNEHQQKMLTQTAF